MPQKESDRIFQKAVGHDEAISQLETEAAAAGRRLTDEEQAYITDLRSEGSDILGTALRASEQERDRALGAVVTADPHGNIMTPRELEDPISDGKSPVSGGGRLAD